MKELEEKLKESEKVIQDQNNNKIVQDEKMKQQE